MLAAYVATPFSRYVAGTWQPGSPIMGRPIRILIAIASPQDLDAYHLPAIDVEKEWTHLQEATRGLDVELVQLAQPCTLSSLGEELRRGHHVLHFTGHGSYRPRDGQATLPAGRGWSMLWIKHTIQDDLKSATRDAIDDIERLLDRRTEISHDRPDTS